jgi:hypothetical protein
MSTPALTVQAVHEKVDEGSSARYAAAQPSIKRVIGHAEPR